MANISWDEFEKVELRVGTIVQAEEFPEARRPAYILHIDFGAELGIRKSSAQITNHYQSEELVGKQVIAVVNFPDKQIGPIMSQCLVTGFYDKNGEVVLAVPDKPIDNGAKLG
jgi:tRNA-binding protein